MAVRRKAQRHRPGSRRRLTACVLAALALLGLCACGGREAEPVSEPAATESMNAPPAYAACDPSFSAEAGAYPEPFLLTLSAPEGYAIYYTTDGSVPTEAAARYEAAIPVESPAPGPDDLAAPENAALQLVEGRGDLLQSEALPSALVVRAVAVAPDGTAGRVVTRSYFTGLDPAVFADGVPVLSIATDDANLLDYDRGILVKGRIWDAWSETPEGREILAADRYWEYEANFTQRGREWERPASLELFDTAEGAILQQDVGIRVRGGASRTYSQRSLNVYFRESYGSGRFSYALIPSAVDTEGATIETYKSFTLRNGGNDSGNLKFRDALLEELLADRHFDYLAARPAIVFLNGEYWGIYALCEKFGKTYIEQHYPGLDGDDVVIVKDGQIDEGIAADAALFDELMAFAQKDLSDPAVWEAFCAAVDVESMADYFAAEIYIGNANWWAEKNTRLWRTRSTQSNNPYGDGRWRFMLYDTEYSSALYNFDKTSAGFDSFAAAMAGHPLFAAAMRSESFRTLFCTALEEIGGSDLAPERVGAKLDEYIARWKPFLQSDYLRFGDTSRIWNWDLGLFRSFFAQRYNAILAHVRNGVALLEAEGNAP